MQQYFLQDILHYIGAEILRIARNASICNEFMTSSKALLKELYTNGRCAGISNLRRISNLLSFLLFRVFFEVQTLLSNMAANSNGQIEGRRESFLL